MMEPTASKTHRPWIMATNEQEEKLDKSSQVRTVKPEDKIALGCERFSGANVPIN